LTGLAGLVVATTTGLAGVPEGLPGAGAREKVVGAGLNLVMVTTFLMVVVAVEKVVPEVV
jgi:hypothetical protein